MAVTVRADMTGRVALGSTEMNKLYAMHRDKEGVIHLRPLDESGQEIELTYAEIRALPRDADVRDRYGAVRHARHVGYLEFTENGPWHPYTLEDPIVG